MTVSKNKEEWKSRTIYQIVTDRFSRSSNNVAFLSDDPSIVSKYAAHGNGDCGDLRKYCGGTFNGITQDLDYIKEMGFDAIWISPIVENTPDSYHGYHFTNLYKINPHFGSEDDFRRLVEAAHSKDIWIMVDIVANHSGPVGYDYQRVTPFNDPSHYHDSCQINPSDFDQNQWRVENCRLADLPDLKQENEFVRTKLLEWIKDIIAKYNIDGIRIDTIPEVPKWFWKQFADAAGVYQVGECFNSRVDYVSDYQNCCLDGVLNYPLFNAMKGTFGYHHGFWEMEQALKDIKNHFKDINALGVFVNNHDNQRFLYYNKNRNNFTNAIVFSLLTEGIPIVYYGDEQYYAGGDDPNNRETMFSEKNRYSSLYQTIKAVNQLRKQKEIWNLEQIQRYADENFYAFTRGDVLALFTNTDNRVDRDITYHSFSEGTKLCNFFDKSYSDCVYVSGGKISVSIVGLPKIYVPK